MTENENANANANANVAEPPPRKSNAKAQVIFVIVGIVLGVGLLFRSVIKNHRQKLPDKLGKVADFTFLERSGKNLALSDLKGEVWVASFIFTRCSGPCQKVSASMSQIHHDPELKGLKLVTFTVDPEHDSVNVLAEYAESARADTKNWFFLTGKKEKIHELIFKSFKLPVEEAKPGSQPIGEQFAHSPRLVLVDREGHIRGYYSSKDPMKVRDLKSAAIGLLSASPKVS